MAALAHTSIPRTDSVFTIDLNRAVELLAQANSGPAPIRVLGSHPTEEGEIAIYSGRYGPYVQHAKIRATIPKSEDPETLTKAAKEAPVKTRKTGAKKIVAKKTTAKTAPRKTAAKKTAAKKVAVKKSVKK